MAILCIGKTLGTRFFEGFKSSKNLVPSVLVGSVTDQFVISPSLLANVDPDAITHPDLRIELLGEPVDLGSEQYAGFVQQRVHPTDCRVSNELDELLMSAPQQYEQSSQQYETKCTEEKLDELALSYSTLNRSTIQWL